MSVSWKVVVGSLVGVAVVGGGAYGAYRSRQPKPKVITSEAIYARPLEALVSASGKIQPKRSVNISADTMGRVTQLAVNEGDIVKQGQFLLQVDPRNLQSAVQRNEASLAAAESQLNQTRSAVDSSKESLALARDTLKRQQELWAAQLTTREALTKAESDVKLRETDVREREQQVNTQAQRIQQERAVVTSARYDLSKVRIESPIDGIVTRRNIEEGETVVVGTMNNAGTVLLTIADMSVVEAELEVDETDIPSLKLGQPAKVTIDAFPDKVFPGRVTEIGNSPIQTTTGTQTASGQAINFKVVVTLDGSIPDVRPGFTCTADVTTDTRDSAVSVPIQALTVREVTFDDTGALVREPRDGDQPAARNTGAPLPPGHTRKETEGVFLNRNGRAEFTPVGTGIAGERYFEVLKGLAVGDEVITGPLNSVRDLVDGDAVRVETSEDKNTFSFFRRP